MVRRRHQLGVAAVADECADPLGVGGGEEETERSAFGDPDPRGAARPGRVHDRDEVLHALLKRRRPAEAIREGLLALVVQDQPAERGEPREEARRRWLLPEYFLMADEARHEHYVQIPVADDLVGRVEAAALRVAHRPGPRLQLARRSWAPRCGRGRLKQLRILAQDPRLEVTQRECRLDAQLLVEPRPEPQVRAEGVRLASRAV